MKLEKILKLLSEEVISDLNELKAADLEKVIVTAEQAIAQAKNELDENEQYQEVKEQAKAISAGFRETRAYQTAKIQYALIRLEESA